MPAHGSEWTGSGFRIQATDDGRYEGAWKDHKRHGQGILYAADGSRFTGEWKDGKRHGRGTLFHPNEAVTKGEWVDGELHGAAVLISPDGQLKTVRFRHGVCIKMDLMPDLM